MAAYLSLTRLEDQKEFKANDLIELDNLICKAVGDDIHPKKWCRDWMDSIGLSLALGKDWLDVRKTWKDCPELMQIIEFLSHRFYNTSYRGS